MTRRDPILLELKHGALIVLTFILAVTAGKFYNQIILMNRHEQFSKKINVSNFDSFETKDVEK